VKTALATSEFPSVACTVFAPAIDLIAEPDGTMNVRVNEPVLDVVWLLGVVAMVRPAKVRDTGEEGANP